ncbi:riboflavin synthase [Oceanibacterium hippocampi]|uniref:Riboflavin synthase n=1 Tax=Oceanibacterium hippocampi TaxID=745714 RepID=A0A1Y5SNZ8_9PROT|nr:riboflavin synthase [Oceanibacterium hippocampi]SLN44902.1 Riboflavin synthase [Oceanibacterium hippocampi]
MFTGIITDVGRVRGIERNGDSRVTIGTAFDTDSIELGASIACSGVCLTVVGKGEDWFAVDVSSETLRCTALGAWSEGSPVNLERALKVGDELGGHVVTGHVDGLATLVSREPEGGSIRLTFEAPAELARYIARKGSVCLDGVSLTVNDVDGARFGINIIPHTQSRTTFGEIAVGDTANLEIDILARYVARLGEANGA